MNQQPHPDGVRLLPWRISGWLIDSVIITVLVVAFIPQPYLDEPSHEAADWIALVVAVVLVLTRRRFPIPTLVAGVVAMAVLLVAAERPSLLMPVLLLAVYNVAVRHERRVALIAGGLTTLALAVLVIAVLEHGDVRGAGLASIAWPAFAAATGTAVRTSRENIAAANERARRAEQTRQLEAHRQVIEERLRIARDVHDLVAHHIAVINVQAGVAGHLMRSDPDAAEVALDTVRDAAGTVLDELGELLSVLRSSEDAEPTTPAPNLASITDVISSFAASGLAVEHRTSGAPRALTESAQLAAYRVVQEALTNAHKHGVDDAVVTQRFDDGRMEISVSNRVGRHDPTGSGFGLVGMRERVEAVGGTLSIDRNASGGRFEIQAVLPAGDPT